MKMEKTAENTVESVDEPSKRNDDDETEKDEAKAVSKNKKYRRPKPWDHDGIDHWKVSYSEWVCFFQSGLDAECIPTGRSI